MKSSIARKRPPIASGSVIGGWLAEAPYWFEVTGAGAAFIFPILAGGSTYLSTWIMQKNQPKSDATASTNKVMNWLMPVMSFVFCLQYNASFAVYWTFSNIFSLGTTLLINRSFAKQKFSVTEVSEK